MKPTKTKRLIAAGALFCSANLLCNINQLHAAVIDFESVALGSLNGPTGVWNGQNGSGGLTINQVRFGNSYTDWGGGFVSWSGFSFSNRTDSFTAGFLNQYSVFSPSGALSSSQFAIGYADAAITFPLTDLMGSGAYFNNTTYAALSMTNGDSFAKKFGGISGNDPDYFTLIIEGYSGGVATGRNIEFHLADYRFTDNSKDFILDKWTFVNFDSLGLVDEIRFSHQSTDVGAFGINTPVYFAMDQLTLIPEPSAMILSSLGLLSLLNIRRRA